MTTNLNINMRSIRVHPHNPSDRCQTKKVNSDTAHCCELLTTHYSSPTFSIIDLACNTACKSAVYMVRINWPFFTMYSLSFDETSTEGIWWKACAMTPLSSALASTSTSV